GHWHVRRDETIQVGSEESRMLLFPSYSGITHHARKVGRSPAFLECGGAVVVDRDHVEWVTETKDLRRYERI
ncbi:MAG: hypothetical protein ACWGQW_25375, partial [bacterium]